MNTRAWTGGSQPRPLGSLHPWEPAVIRHLFREQWRTWQRYWGERQDRPTRRLLWNHARHDAHATIRAVGQDVAELRRMLRGKPPGTNGAVDLAGHVIAARVCRAGISRTRLRWSVDGRPATLRDVTALATVSESV